MEFHIVISWFLFVEKNELIPPLVGYGKGMVCFDDELYITEREKDRPGMWICNSRNLPFNTFPCQIGPSLAKQYRNSSSKLLQYYQFYKFNNVYPI